MLTLVVLFLLLLMILIAKTCIFTAFQWLPRRDAEVFVNVSWFSVLIPPN